MAWYSSGTVALTANSTTVTGTGTQFLGNIRIGDGLVIAGSAALHEVTGISSDTQLTFQPPFAGDAGSGLNYAAVPVLGYDKDLSDAFNRLRLEIGDHLKNLQDLQDWVLDPSNAAIDAAASARLSAQSAESDRLVTEQRAAAAEESRQAADSSRDTAVDAAAAAESSKGQAGVYEQQSGENAAAAEASRIAAEQAAQDAEGLVPTETPGPGRIPKADAIGFLDVDWVPFSETGKDVATGNAEDGRAALGLGTAATATVTTGAQDTEMDRVLKSGNPLHRVYNEHGKAFGTFNATDLSVNAWNQFSNIHVRMQARNNVMAFLLGGTSNSREGGIQVGHYAPEFASAVGTLHLNPFGGDVRASNRLMYHQGNILGTVSQSGGVPTGALVEYGSNSNGEYWRYAGGMQIAVKREVHNSTVNPGSGTPINTDTSAQFVGHQNTHVSGGFRTGSDGTGSLLYTLMVSGDGTYYMYNHGTSPASVNFNYTVGSLTAASRVIKVLTVGRWY